jgi:repressor LexA
MSTHWLDNSPFIHHNRAGVLVPLTKRQKDILDYLTHFLQHQGYSPTLEEIADHFGLASLNGVYKHLRALEARGFIRRLSNQARSIQVLEPAPSRRAVLPLLGYIAAGQPMEAVPDVEEISVPESFLTRGRNYVLKVRGNSMIDEHIQDGDYVVVEQREEARNGETVIALIDGESSTLKTFYRKGNRIRLQPANPDLAPVDLEENRVKIQGVVIGVMRRY